MSPEKSLSRYILVILSVSVVVTALVIVALNAYVSNKKLSESNNGTFLNNALSSFSYDDGYKDGYNAAREKFNIAPSELRAITGTVQSITPNSLKLEAINLDTDEFVDGVSNVRTALITSSTKVLHRSNLSGEELGSAMQKWQNNPGDNPPPLPYTEKEVTVSEISEGSAVTVISKNDIRFSQSFDADQIIITSISD
ncbi:MAG: hypothetical protein P1P90_02685 [Patescibacteria group bacterium]|nr:hypothetical protein [Patescibacteria group bacterium]